MKYENGGSIHALLSSLNFEYHKCTLFTLQYFLNLKRPQRNIFFFSFLFSFSSFRMRNTIKANLSSEFQKDAALFLFIFLTKMFYFHHTVRKSKGKSNKPNTLRNEIIFLYIQGNIVFFSRNKWVTYISAKLFTYIYIYRQHGISMYALVLRNLLTSQRDQHRFISQIFVCVN